MIINAIFSLKKVHVECIGITAGSSGPIKHDCGENLTGAVVEGPHQDCHADI